MGNFKKTLEWWPVIVAVLVGSAAAGAFQVRVGALEAKADKCDALESRIVRVEEAVSQLPEIRSDIKELLRRSK